MAENRPRRRFNFTWTVDTETEPLNIFDQDLPMYKDPPGDNIRFAQFQEMCHERLSVLNLVENIGSQFLSSPKECLQELLRSLRNKNLREYAHLFSGRNCSSQTEEACEIRKRDVYSHFALLLAGGTKSQFQPWFFKNEVALFRWRLTVLNKEGISQFIRKYNLNIRPISTTEKTENYENLANSSFREIDVYSLDFYKVPFDQVPDLISSRKVFFQRGLAYVPETELGSYFVHVFKEHLQKQLANAPEWVRNIKGDDRLKEFLELVPDYYRDLKKNIWNPEQMPLEKLQKVWKKSFPLCMRILKEKLEEKGHLKNSGRFTYTLFLKGIGVSLDDALVYWQDVFDKGNLKDSWSRQRYWVRHHYGKEGRKVNYTPLACSKLIDSTVGKGEYHGCPYRYMDSISLKNQLLGYDFTEDEVQEIVELKENAEYFDACKTCFEITHNHFQAKFVHHPNSYFLESQEILNRTDSPDFPDSYQLIDAPDENETFPTKDCEPICNSAMSDSENLASQNLNSATQEVVVREDLNIITVPDSQNQVSQCTVTSNQSTVNLDQPIVILDSQNIEEVEEIFIIKVQETEENKKVPIVTLDESDDDDCMVLD